MGNSNYTQSRINALLEDIGTQVNNIQLMSNDALAHHLKAEEELEGWADFITKQADLINAYRNRDADEHNKRIDEYENRIAQLEQELKTVVATKEYYQSRLDEEVENACNLKAALKSMARAL